jgi:hypothetical protein
VRDVNNSLRLAAESGGRQSDDARQSPPSYTDQAEQGPRH